MAEESADRCYHGVALLLPNGKVLSAGSGEGGGTGSNPPKYCMTNAQLFQPSYLFKGGRPIVSNIPDEVEYGQSFSATIQSDDSISRISWIRLGSVTHGMNMNQAVWYQRLDPAPKGQLTAQVPDNRYVAPPGHYMVFFVNAQGVPSIAPIVQISAKITKEEKTPPKPATAATSTNQVAISNAERDKQIIAEQNKPAVAIGLTPVCPYGLGPCWGGASEGLRSISNVDIVRPVPNQAGSVAYVYLRDDALPDIDVWRNEFAKTVNGSYSMRGIEMTLPGVVNKKQTGSEEVLILAATLTRPEVALAPFQATSKIEWDMATQSPHPVSDQELAAYASLLSALGSSAAGATVEVTGRLNKMGANEFSLDVREFKIDSSVTGS